jgi:hypothetical protein
MAADQGSVWIEELTGWSAEIIDAARKDADAQPGKFRIERGLKVAQTVALFIAAHNLAACQHQLSNVVRQLRQLNGSGWKDDDLVELAPPPPNGLRAEHYAGKS